jgi:excisionase family DNA binding protein
MDDNTTPDFLYGAAKIASHLGVKRSVVYHLIETGQLPARKSGSVVCCSRQDIRTYIDSLKPIVPRLERVNRSHSRKAA